MRSFRRRPWHQRGHVYIVHSAATGEILYVGSTSDPYQRVRNHQRSSKWWRAVPGPKRVQFRSLRSVREAQEYERKITPRLRPAFNVYGFGPGTREARRRIVDARLNRV